MGQGQSQPEEEEAPNEDIMAPPEDVRVNPDGGGQGTNQRANRKTGSIIPTYKRSTWFGFTDNRSSIKEQEETEGPHDGGESARCRSKQHEETARKLSNVSHRNVQLLSMRPRNERDTYADSLRCRRRSSLINMILGAPSSGPRFCDDLCSLSSRVSNFGIESFPDYYHHLPGSMSSLNNRDSNVAPNNQDQQSVCSLGLATRHCVRPEPRSSLIIDKQNNKKPQGSSGTDKYKQEPADAESLAPGTVINLHSRYRQHRRRSSEGSLRSSDLPLESAKNQIAQQEGTSRNKLANLGQSGSLASIDLTSSFEQAPKLSGEVATSGQEQPAGACAGASKYKHRLLLNKLRMTSARMMNNKPGRGHNHNNNNNNSNSTINNNNNPVLLRRSGSELSLYSNASGSSADAASCCYPNEAIMSRFRNITAGGKSRDKGASRKLEKLAHIEHHWRAKDAPLVDYDDNEERRKTINSDNDSMKETKLIILVQVCLPFLFAGLGNMSAGLVLSRVATWDVFKDVSTFLVLLPPLVGLKGNIEMTMASRLSTLANLNLLDTRYRCRRAYVSNLALVLSQAICLALFASLVATLCPTTIHHPINVPTDFGKNVIENQQVQGTEYNFGQNVTQSSSHANEHHHHHANEQVAGFQSGSRPELTYGDRILLVVASALATSILLVILSSFIMSGAILLARLIQVNPDNLSTLVAALYGDVSCVLVYGCIVNLLYGLIVSSWLWLMLLVGLTLVLWPCLCFASYKCEETQDIALRSLPPMFTSIIISMGSGK